MASCSEGSIEQGKRALRLCIGMLVALALCACGVSSRDEVLRVTSPDGQIDAIIFETNCGATCPFGYEVRLASKGTRSGEEAALLEGACRNEKASGVNVRWLNANVLAVEYLRAKHLRFHKLVQIEGRTVEVSVHAGVSDPQAPAGGMLYNLSRR